jgi:hypothetical protein
MGLVWKKFTAAARAGVSLEPKFLAAWRSMAATRLLSIDDPTVPTQRSAWGARDAVSMRRVVVPVGLAPLTGRHRNLPRHLKIWRRPANDADRPPARSLSLPFEKRGALGTADDWRRPAHQDRAFERTEPARARDHLVGRPRTARRGRVRASLGVMRRGVVSCR